jgi:hypothetical protein
MALLLLLAFAGGVSAHGRLSTPKARQVIANERGLMYNPNGGNGAQSGPPGKAQHCDDALSNISNSHACYSHSAPERGHQQWP